MAMIKSALELALERTKNLKVDEASLALTEAKTEGRKSANRFLEAPDFELQKAIDACPAETRENFRYGVFEVFSGQIQLPSGFFDAEKFEKISSGLAIVAKTAKAPDSHGGHAPQGQSDKQVLGLAKQIASFLAKYLDEVKRVEQAIRTQWAPKLKEKQRQLSSRMGQDVQIDPMSDPEFAAFYKQNVEGLKKSYSDALEQAKNDLSSLCGILTAAS
jgi:hypothetical protein